MKETMGARLRSARKERGLSLESVGKRFRISAQAVQQWEKDRTIPDAGRLNTVAQLYGVSVEWLITGRELRASPGGVNHVTHLKGRLVPKLQTLEAARGEKRDNDNNQLVHTHFPCSAHSYCIEIQDQANAPKFEIGDSVIIDPELMPEPGDMILADIGDGDGVVFRRIKFLAGGTYLLQPLNSLWHEIQIGKETPGAILGVMTEHTQPRRAGR